MWFWLLKILPAFIVHAVLAAGFVIVLASYLMGRFPLRIAGIATIFAGIFLEGCLATQLVWEQKVKDMEQKVQEAERKAAVINEKIVEKVVVEQKIVKEKGDDIIKYIDHEIVKVDSSCKIPSSVIKVHNAAALNEPIVDQAAALNQAAAPPGGNK